jgi:hypothetical protein
MLFPQFLLSIIVPRSPFIVHKSGAERQAPVGWVRCPTPNPPLCYVNDMSVFTVDCLDNNLFPAVAVSQCRQFSSVCVLVAQHTRLENV